MAESDHKLSPGTSLNYGVHISSKTQPTPHRRAYTPPCDASTYRKTASWSYSLLTIDSHLLSNAFSLPCSTDIPFSPKAILMSFMSTLKLRFEHQKCPPKSGDHLVQQVRNLNLLTARLLSSAVLKTKAIKNIIEKKRYENLLPQSGS